MQIDYCPQGWQCPVCKRVMSPTMLWCVFCGNESVTITNATDFTTITGLVELDQRARMEPPEEVSGDA